MLFDNIISFTSSGQFTLAYDLMAEISKQCCQHCKCTQDCLLWFCEWEGEARQRTSCSSISEFCCKSLKWFPQVIRVLFQSCAHQILPASMSFQLSHLYSTMLAQLYLDLITQNIQSVFLFYIIFYPADNNSSSQKYISDH